MMRRFLQSMHYLRLNLLPYFTFQIRGTFRPFVFLDGGVKQDSIRTSSRAIVIYVTLPDNTNNVLCLKLSQLSVHSLPDPVPLEPCPSDVQIYDHKAPAADKITVPVNFPPGGD